MEHARIGAAGANGRDQRPFGEHHSFAGVEVGGRDRKRNLQVFEGGDPQNAGTKLCHAVVAAKAVARERPAREMFEAGGAGNFLDFAGIHPRAIARPDDCAHAGSGDELHRDLGFLQCLQNTDMRQAAGKAAAQGQPQLQAPRGQKLRA